MNGWVRLPSGGIINLALAAMIMPVYPPGGVAQALIHWAVPSYQHSDGGYGSSELERTTFIGGDAEAILAAAEVFAMEAIR